MRICPCLLWPIRFTNCFTLASSLEITLHNKGSYFIDQVNFICDLLLNFRFKLVLILAHFLITYYPLEFHRYIFQQSPPQSGCLQSHVPQQVTVLRNLLSVVQVLLLLGSVFVVNRQMWELETISSVMGPTLMTQSRFMPHDLCTLELNEVTLAISPLMVCIQGCSFHSVVLSTGLTSASDKSLQSQLLCMCSWNI